MAAVTRLAYLSSYVDPNTGATKKFVIRVDFKANAVEMVRCCHGGGLGVEEREREREREGERVLQVAAMLPPTFSVEAKHNSPSAYVPSRRLCPTKVCDRSSRGA